MLQNGQRKAYAGTVTVFWLNGYLMTARFTKMDIGVVIAFI
jgi:hypothetical protein